MFSNISEILKSFSPAQRIIALLILVCTIVIVTLGPKWIDSNTSDCSELTARIQSLESQNSQLNARVDELNTQLISGQQQCTDNLIQKQQEIMGIINGMIAETERGITTREKCKQPERYSPPVEESTDPNEPRVAMMVMPQEPQKPAQTEDLKTMLSKLKKLKTSVNRTMSGSN